MPSLLTHHKHKRLAKQKGYVYAASEEKPIAILGYLLLKH
jgi:hypothetical protein